MNIRQYYQQTALINLNGCLVSLAMASILLLIYMLFSWELPFFVIAVPFLLVCFYQYAGYRVNQSRFDQSQESRQQSQGAGLYSENHLLISFSPAPAVRLLFFTPDGMLAGEVKEDKVSKWRWFLPYFLDVKMKKKLGLYRADGKLQALFLLDGKGIKIFNEKKEVVGLYYHHKKEEKRIGMAILTGGRKLVCERSRGTKSELHFRNEKSGNAAELREGWMPLEWSNYFKDAYTPVLTFEYGLPQAERMAVFASLVQHYLYYNH